jgi:hypothetical protein
MKPITIKTFVDLLKKLELDPSSLSDEEKRILDSNGFKSTRVLAEAAQALP